ASISMGSGPSVAGIRLCERFPPPPLPASAGADSTGAVSVGIGHPLRPPRGLLGEGTPYSGGVEDPPITRPEGRDPACPRFARKEGFRKAKPPGEFVQRHDVRVIG